MTDSDTDLSRELDRNQVSRKKVPGDMSISASAVRGVSKSRTETGR